MEATETIETVMPISPPYVVYHFTCIYCNAMCRSAPKCNHFNQVFLQ